MKNIKLVGRLEEASNYIEFSIEGGYECESKSYEFYISADGRNLFVNANLEKDQLSQLLSIIPNKLDREFMKLTIARCGYGL